MYKTVLTPEFEQILNREGFLDIIDVRDPWDFEMGHVANASNIPLPLLESDYVSLDTDKTYYIICLTGNRSETACYFLSRKGINCVNVMGGMSIFKGELEQ